MNTIKRYSTYMQMLDIWDAEDKEWVELGKRLVSSFVQVMAVKCKYQKSYSGLVWDLKGEDEAYLHEISSVLLYGIDTVVTKDSYKISVKYLLKAIEDVAEESDRLGGLNGDKASTVLFNDVLSVLRTFLKEDTEDLVIQIEIL